MVTMDSNICHVVKVLLFSFVVLNETNRKPNTWLVRKEKKHKGVRIKFHYKFLFFFYLTKNKSSEGLITF